MNLIKSLGILKSKVHCCKNINCIKKADRLFISFISLLIFTDFFFSLDFLFCLWNYLIFSLILIIFAPYIFLVTRHNQIYYYCFQWTHPFIVVMCPSLSLIILFVLCSVVPNIHTTMPILLCLLAAWYQYICFHPYTLNLSVSFCVNCIS